MKRTPIALLGTLLAVLLALSLAGIVSGLKWGDANGDGDVKMGDAMWVARYAVGLPATPFYQDVADVNRDGEVRIGDAMFIAKWCAGITVPYSIGRENFIFGADISWVQQQEKEGMVFSDEGVPKDILEILKDHAFNYIRLRIFHTPGAEGGYAYGLPENYCDLEHTMEMAQRIKEAGMGFLLDFHYSDTWADPTKQYKPLAWENLSFDELTSAVHDYTKDVLEALENQGTLPDMVQIGNEIDSGFLWPDGDISDFNKFTTLLKAAIAAVREVDPSIKIVLHIAKGGDASGAEWWVNSVLQKGVEFDILGLSCYPQWHGPPSEWRETFNYLASRFPDLYFIIAEYSWYKENANDIIYELPGGRGLGTFIWEPTEWGESLFNSNGETNSRIDIYPRLAAKYGNIPTPPSPPPPPPPPPTPLPYVVYSDNGIPENTHIEVWGTDVTFDNACTTESAPEGSMCFKITGSGWLGGAILYGWDASAGFVDLSSSSYLKFWVKTPVNLQVGINDLPEVAWISNYGWNGTDTWQEITIPASVFTGLEQVFCPFKVTTTSSVEGTTYYIDYVRWGA